MLNINFKKIFKDFDLGLFAVLAVCFAFVFPLLKSGFYTMYDDMQVARVWQMDKCVTDGQIPCRWVPDLGLGYGYPLFNYYAPFPYYVMDLIHLLGVPFVESVKLGFILSVLLSSVFFYKFLRLRFSAALSFFGTFLFIYAPYRASDIFVRGAMGEVWGITAVSILLYSIEKLFHNSKLTTKLLLVIGVFIFLISHNLTVLIFSLFILGYFVIRLVEENYKIKELSRFLIPALLGTGLASFYIFPMFFERNLVHIDTLTAGYFGYLQHFLSLKQIFWSMHWGYGPSILGPNDDAFLGIGAIHFIIFIISLILLLYIIFRRLSNRKNLKFILMPLFLIISFFISAFLTHEKSTFIYKLFSFLQIIQFPWRFVMVLIFIIPIFAAYVFNYLNKKLCYVVTIISFLIVAVFYFPVFKPKDWFALTDAQKLSGELLEKQLTASIYDYLPIVARKAPDNVPANRSINLGGNYQERLFEKGSNWYRIDLNVNSQEAKIALPAYDFSNWNVYVDKKEVNVSSSGDYGLVTFTVGNGMHQILAKQTDTPVRTVSNSITLFSLGLLIVWVIYEKNKKSFPKK